MEILQIWAMMEGPSQIPLWAFVGDVSPAGELYIRSDNNTFQIIDISTPAARLDRILNASGGNFGDIFDIAFNPVDGLIYSYRQNEGVIQISPNTGQVTTFNETSSLSPLSGASGAVYFDAVGNLTVYNNPSGDLYRFSLDLDAQTSTSLTGTTPLLTGPSVTQNDGAGCPFFLSLQKSVDPPVTTPGGIVTYTYAIANPNPEGLTVVGNLFDDLPDDGRTYVEGSLVIPPEAGSPTANAFGGTDILEIQNITIPSNGLEISIDVLIPPDSPAGSVLNQARLSLLPGFGGDSVFSDFPASGPLGDPTPLQIIDAQIGVAKAAGTPVSNGDGTFDIPFTITLENFGNTGLQNVQVEENLTVADSFDSPTTFTIATAPSVNITSGSGSLAGNSNFDGTTSDPNLLAAGGTLDVGAIAEISFTVQVTPNGDLGPYTNQVVARGEAPGGIATTTDLSDDGADPDPDQDGNPNEEGENDPTVISLSGAPDFLLVKRITALNGSPFTDFVDDPSDADNNSLWPTPLSTFLAGETSIIASPGDEVEFTLYFLNAGTGSASNIQICDPLSENQDYIADAFNSQSPRDGGLPNDLGIQLSLGAANPVNAFLTGANDPPDRGRFVAAGTAPPNCLNPDTLQPITANENTNGTIVVNVTRATGTPPLPQLPNALSPGDPDNSYGFIRFLTRIR